MFSLLFLHAALLATGLILVALLQLPTRILRWSFAIGFASAQLVLSIQILSLFGRLHAAELLWINLLISAAAVTIGSIWLRKRPKLTLARTATLREFLCEIGVVNIALAGACAVAALVLTVVGRAVFPANDPYHIGMCLFWSQNGSIAAFPVYDPRIVSVVFASEAMALPGIIYSRSPALFVLHSVIWAGLCTWAVYAVARAIGAARKPAFTTALAFAASTPLLGGIWGAKSDFLISAFWLLISVLCVFEYVPDHRRNALFLGCSAFAFAMACGVKNTVLLHGPAYVLLFLLVLKREAFRLRYLAVMAVTGMAGAIASGMLWSYVQNQHWFGDWRGHPYLKATLAQDYDPHSVWTRLCRSFVFVVYDCGWLPNSLQPAYANVAAETIRLLHGETSLREDNEFYRMDLATFRPGNGMGIIGPLVLLPSLAGAVWLSLRGSSRRSSPDVARFRALTVFAAVSFLVFFVVLRTQKVGVLRLMLSCVAAAMPLCWIMVRVRIGVIVASAASSFSILLNVAHGASFAAHRHQIPSLAKLAALKRTPPETAEIVSGEGNSQQITIQEPYTHREVYALALKSVNPGAVVGFIGEFYSEGFLSFGKEYANAVISLNDSRSGKIEIPPERVEYLFIEDRDPRIIPDEVLRGFTRLFEARRGDKTFFAFYKRTPVTDLPTSDDPNGSPDRR